MPLTNFQSQVLRVLAAQRSPDSDIADGVAIHENVLSLGAVITAAVGRFPGITPEEMLSEITRHSRFTAEEFQVLATEQPIDPPSLHRRIHAMIEDAEVFIANLPSEAVGVIFLQDSKPVQPNPSELELYQRHVGARRGHWPSSSEIGHAMLSRYQRPE